MKTVAFQGEPGAFSEEAAFHLCGNNCSVLPCRTFEAVADAIAKGTADCGVLPVQNSLVGLIHSSIEVLEASALRITRELQMPIHHCLMALPGATIHDIKIVISHPAALAQCKKFLNHYPEFFVEGWYDTAGAAREVAAKKDKSLAAIASKRAAKRYKLDILHENVEDAADNRTRFVLVTA